jgi:hypothetical protein
MVSVADMTLFTPLRDEFNEPEIDSAPEAEKVDPSKVEASVPCRVTTPDE